MYSSCSARYQPPSSGRHHRRPFLSLKSPLSVSLFLASPRLRVPPSPCHQYCNFNSPITISHSLFASFPALSHLVPPASGIASAIRVTAIYRGSQVTLNNQHRTRRADAQPLASPLHFAIQISNQAPSTKHQAPAIQPIPRNRRPAALQSISRTSHRQPRLVQNMSINHRRLHIHVPQ